MATVTNKWADTMGQLSRAATHAAALRGCVTCNPDEGRAADEMLAQIREALSISLALGRDRVARGTMPIAAGTITETPPARRWRISGSRIIKGVPHYTQVVVYARTAERAMEAAWVKYNICRNEVRAVAEAAADDEHRPQWHHSDVWFSEAA